MAAARVLWKALVDEEANALARWTLGPLLGAVSYPYNWVHQLRLQAYRRHWAPVRRLPCRVISIGNLTLGGTGKTPLVELVATLLQQAGARVCVLSRGYGGTRASGATVVSDGLGHLLPAAIAGDEPVLLAEHLTTLPVIVGKDRYAAGRLAIERFGVDTIVLDDGFQHVQLARDLNILLLDARRPFGNGRLFPRGELRESPAALARADAIVLTRWESEATTAPLAEAIGRVNLPLFRSQHTPRDLRALSGAQILPISVLKGQRIAAFCGIAVPNHFRLTLQRLGADIVSFVAFPDHHPYTPGEIRQLGLIAKRQEADFIVTTEKDGVRLRHMSAGVECMWELRIHATAVEPEAVWQSYLVNGLGGQAGACL